LPRSFVKMSRSSRRKHINKLKKAKNKRKAVAKLQGTTKMKSREINFSEGLVKIAERKELWKTDIDEGKVAYR